MRRRGGTKTGRSGLPGRNLRGGPAACLALAALCAAASTGPLAQEADVLWSTYLGGSGRDFAWGMDHGSDGSIFVVGETFSVDFPTTPGAFDRVADDEPEYAEGFLSRLNPIGQRLMYGTFLGGSGHDVCRDVVLDSAGNIYIAGITSSPDFPVTPDALDSSYNCCNDVFVVKLDPTGRQILFSTYIGGTGADKARAVAVLEPDLVYVAGHTDSPEFPVTAGAFDETQNGGWDVFVTCIDLSKNEVVYSTLIGGINDDEPWDLAVDAEGNAYVAGFTKSADFPVTAGAFDGYYSGNADGFVAKVTPAGDALVYSTFLGGSDLERVWRLAVNGAGEVIAAGFTRSPGFPVTAGVYDASFNGDEDGFVTRLAADGRSLVFSTFLGGSSADRCQGIGLGEDGYVYVTGGTFSPDFPVFLDSEGLGHSGSSDLFVSVLEPLGRGLAVSSFLGGPGYEAPWGLTLVEDHVVAVCGTTDDLPYPATPGAYSTENNGGGFDGIVSKLAMIPYASSVPDGAGAAGGPASMASVLRVFPNPSPRAFGVDFELEGSGRVTVDLTDIGGRRVGSLFDGWRGEGRHHLAWDRGLSAGTYFLRMTTPSSVLSRKVTLGR